MGFLVYNGGYFGCDAMNRLTKQLVLLLLILSVMGCGLKGDLQLPEEPQPTQQP